MTPLFFRRLFAILIVAVAILGTESFAQAIGPCGTYSINVNVVDPTLTPLNVILDLTDVASGTNYTQPHSGLGNGFLGSLPVPGGNSMLNHVTVLFANGFAISFTAGTWQFCVGGTGTTGPCIEVTMSTVGAPCDFMITITELPAGSCPSAGC